MQTASGLVIMSNMLLGPCTTILLINKDGKWGFTGGTVAEHLFDSKNYQKLHAAAYMLHHTNTGFNPNGISPYNVHNKKIELYESERHMLLDYIEELAEDKKVRLVHFVYEMGTFAPISEYLSEILIEKPRYGRSQLMFFTLDEITAFEIQGLLLPNVIKVVKELKDQSLIID